VKDIVLGLRNFSRLDKGEVGELDANVSLENTAKLLNSQIKNRIQLHWDLCPDARFRANTSQINQVFMNILANALQSIEGKGEVWIKTWIASREGSESLFISIRDSGKGIKPDHIDKIFDPFFTTKKVGEGTGLGLSIVYGIIERHRGQVQVKSQQSPDVNHGTEFIISFPRWGAPFGSNDSESAA
jgi:two-component system, NtrC family, sensor kinase